MLLASLDLHWHAKMSSLLIPWFVSICSITLNMRSERNCKFTQMWFEVRRWQADERPTVEELGRWRRRFPSPVSSGWIIIVINFVNELMCWWNRLNQISWVEMWTTGRDKDAENPLMRWINRFNSASAFWCPRLNLPVRVRPIYLWRVDNNKNNSVSGWEHEKKRSEALSQSYKGVLVRAQNYEAFLSDVFPPWNLSQQNSFSRPTSAVG